MDKKDHYSDELQDFLSGHLTGDQMSAVEGHLQTCDQCRKELEALRWTKQMLSKVPVTEPPLQLRENVLKTLDRQNRKFQNWKKYVAYAAVIMIVALGLFYFLHNDVASSVANDFRDFQSGKLQLQVHTKDEKEMEGYFKTHGIPFPTRVFDLAMMKYDLIGGRVHQLLRHRSALFVYGSEEGQILICQMYPGISSDLPKDAAIREHNGIKFYIYERRGLTTVFWQEGDVLCVLVSDIPSQQVVDLAIAKAMLPSKL